MKTIKEILGIGLLSGTILGAGIFSLPYITYKVGIFPMILYFLVLGSILTSIHIFVAKISLRTPDFKRLPGFVGYYLGETLKKISLFLTIFGLFGTLLSYLILGGSFLEKIFNQLLNIKLPSIYYYLFYFLFGILFIYFGIKAIDKIELISLSLFIFILIFIFFREKTLINFNNFIFFQKSNLSNLFLPYGPLIFALWGVDLIPELEELLEKSGKRYYI